MVFIIFNIDFKILKTILNCAIDILCPYLWFKDYKQIVLLFCIHYRINLNSAIEPSGT